MSLSGPECTTRRIVFCPNVSVLPSADSLPGVSVLSAAAIADPTIALLEADTNVNGVGAAPAKPAGRSAANDAATTTLALRQTLIFVVISIALPVLAESSTTNRTYGERRKFRHRDKRIAFYGRSRATASRLQCA